MVEGHGRDVWNHTAALLCKLHNVNCAKKSDVIRDLNVFHPYAQQHKGGKRRQRVTVAALSAALGIVPPVPLEVDECLVVERLSPAVPPSRPASTTPG